VIVIAVVLLLLIAVVVVAAVYAGNEPTTLDLLNATIDTSVRWIFLTGALCVLVAVFAVSLLLNGLRRARKRRHELQDLKADRSERPRDRDDRQDPDERDHFESTPRER